jgi:hypothetical protein
MTTEASRRIPRPSHNFVPEYQMSGIPHVETRNLPARANNAEIIENISDHKFTFNSVTRWLIINNHSNNADKHLRVYFNETAAKTAYDSGNDNTDDSDLHYYELNGDEQSRRLEIKCKEIYLIPDKINDTFDVTVIAGLTNIAASDFPDQTKNNGFTGVED